ncbi:hypothetical protein [Paenibacillus sp. UNC451MF]|uniref:hypothetical protein n=1 Tax=Paenibacillus sp. UNC451MF TaxID=1449063 RepID=UPI000566FECB|nr:hypothetical protein [Paenibacillus sp. UNC451MF]
MVIALENEPPAQGQFEQLLASVEEHESNAELLYQTYCQSSYVIAAYDKGRLIGVGRVTGKTDANHELQITVLEDNRYREIEACMRRLLSIHRF